MIVQCETKNTALISCPYLRQIYTFPIFSLPDSADNF